MSFGTKLKELREEKGLSQADFARCMGLTRSAISMYELGKREPNIGLLQTFANFFEVTIDELVNKPVNDKTKQDYITLHRLVDELHPDEVKEVIDFAKLRKNKQSKTDILNDDEF